MASITLTMQSSLMRFVNESKGQIRRKLITEAPTTFLSAVRELCLNFLAGNLQCSIDDRGSIEPYTEVIRHLSHKTKPLWYKRHLLIKYGHHFLPVLYDNFRYGNGTESSDGELSEDGSTYDE